LAAYIPILFGWNWNPKNPTLQGGPLPVIGKVITPLIGVKKPQLNPVLFGHL